MSPILQIKQLNILLLASWFHSLPYLPSLTPLYFSFSLFWLHYFKTSP